jgi:tRNA(Ile)-lysidine synthetase-like protein
MDMDSSISLQLEPGRYVVAVSGGVDSVVLVHLLYRAYKSQPDKYQFVIAHFDHGIREDSAVDAAFVRELAASARFDFELGQGNLGEGSSEAEARSARYAFLHDVAAQTDADAILTAHHEDDVVETAIINMVRGTGPRGLCALKTKRDMIRPLLHYRKRQLLQYAEEQGLTWHEDSTNRAVKYLRNYVRIKVLPLAGMKIPKFHEQMMGYITRAAELAAESDRLLYGVVDQYFSDRDNLPRHAFIMLPHVVAKEVMATIMRTLPALDYDKKLIERLVIVVKTAQPGTVHDIDKNWILNVQKTTWQIVPRDTSGDGRV